MTRLQRLHRNVKARLRRARRSENRMRSAMGSPASKHWNTRAYNHYNAYVRTKELEAEERVMRFRRKVARQ